MQICMYDFSWQSASSCWTYLQTTLRLDENTLRINRFYISLINRVLCSFVDSWLSCFMRFVDKSIALNGQYACFSRPTACRLSAKMMLLIRLWHAFDGNSRISWPNYYLFTSCLPIDFFQIEGVEGLFLEWKLVKIVNESWVLAKRLFPLPTLFHRTNIGTVDRWTGPLLHHRIIPPKALCLFLDASVGNAIIATYIQVFLGDSWFYFINLRCIH